MSTIDINDIKPNSYKYKEETAEKIKTLPARDAQTGPAIRGDKRVIKMHCELLAEHPQHLELYNLLSNSIYQTFNQ